MYICICRGVTDREITAAVGNGLRSVTELAQCLGVGTGCGRCLESVGTLLSPCTAATAAESCERSRPVEPAFSLTLA